MYPVGLSYCAKAAGHPVHHAILTVLALLHIPTPCKGVLSKRHPAGDTACRTWKLAHNGQLQCIISQTHQSGMPLSLTTDVPLRSKS